MPYNKLPHLITSRALTRNKIKILFFFQLDKLRLAAGLFEPSHGGKLLLLLHKWRRSRWYIERNKKTHVKRWSSSNDNRRTDRSVPFSKIQKAEDEEEEGRTENSNWSRTGPWYYDYNSVCCCPTACLSVCWEWDASNGTNGRVQCNLDPHLITVHRHAYHIGPVRSAVQQGTLIRYLQYNNKKRRDTQCVCVCVCIRNNHLT